MSTLDEQAPDDPSEITAELAARMLEGQPPIRLELTLAEADLLIAYLRSCDGLSAALIAERVRLQALPQAREICLRVALLQAPVAGESPSKGALAN